MNAKAIGERLKKLRGEKTLAEVAEGCNLTTQALSNYENGIRIPRDIHKISIARYYGVTVGSIFLIFRYTIRVREGGENERHSTERNRKSCHG